MRAFPLKPASDLKRRELLELVAERAAEIFEQCAGMSDYAESSELCMEASSLYELWRRGSPLSDAERRDYRGVLPPRLIRRSCSDLLSLVNAELREAQKANPRRVARLRHSRARSPRTSRKSGAMRSTPHPSTCDVEFPCWDYPSKRAFQRKKRTDLRALKKTMAEAHEGCAYMPGFKDHFLPMLEHFRALYEAARPRNWK